MLRRNVKFSARSGAPEGVESALDVRPAAEFTACGPHDPHPCRKDPPLIDAMELWDCADDSARRFTRDLASLWKDASGFPSRALTQAHFFKYLAALIVIALAIGCGVGAVSQSASIAPVLRGLSFEGGALVLAAATFCVFGTLSVLVERLVLCDRFERRKTDLANTLQDRLRQEIILRRGHLIADGVQRLDIGQADSGERSEACVATLFREWRSVQLIPYVTWPDWVAFRNPNVLRRERKEVRSWFWMVFGVTLLACIILGAVDAAGIEYGLPEGGWLSGGAAFAPMALTLRVHFAGNSRQCVEAIEFGLKWHQITASEAKEWTQEIAHFDPSPQIARKHREALDAFYDLMRRK